MFGTIVAIDALLAFATIPEEPLVEPATGGLVVAAILVVCAGLMWLVSRGWGWKAGFGKQATAGRPVLCKGTRLRAAHSGGRL